MKRKSKKFFAGVVCAIVGIIGLFGVFSIKDNIIYYVVFCFALAAVGIFLIISELKKKVAPPSPQNQSKHYDTVSSSAATQKRYTDNEVKNYVNSLVSFKFPESDGDGNRLLKVYELTLTGSKKSHNGVEAQQTISNLKIGEQVILSAQPNNKYDETAVMVTDSKGNYAGWLPVDSGELETMNLKDDVFGRLTSGYTVYARVSDIGDMKKTPEFQYCTIEIARYSKPRAKAVKQ